MPLFNQVDLKRKAITAFVELARTLDIERILSGFMAVRPIARSYSEHQLRHSVEAILNRDLEDNMKIRELYQYWLTLLKDKYPITQESKNIPQTYSALKTIFNSKEPIMNNKTNIEEATKLHTELEKMTGRKVSFAEGTWAVPDTPDKIAQLQQHYEQIEQIKQKLYYIAGDDKLFDYIGDACERMQEMIDDGQAKYDGMVAGAEKRRAKETKGSEREVKAVADADDHLEPAAEPAMPEVPADATEEPIQEAKQLHAKLQALTGKKVVFAEAKRSLNEKKEIEFDKRFGDEVTAEMNKLGEGGKISPNDSQEWISYAPSTSTGNKPNLQVFYQMRFDWADKGWVTIGLSCHLGGYKGQESEDIFYDVSGDQQRQARAEAVVIQTLIPRFKLYAQGHLKNAVAQGERFFDSSAVGGGYEYEPKDEPLLSKFVQNIPNLKAKKSR